jgi:hypothetical protein
MPARFTPTPCFHTRRLYFYTYSTLSTSFIFDIVATGYNNKLHTIDIEPQIFDFRFSKI